MTIYCDGRKGGAFLPNVSMVKPFPAVLCHEAPACPDATRKLHGRHSNTRAMVRRAENRTDGGACQAI